MKIYFYRKKKISVTGLTKLMERPVEKLIMKLPFGLYMYRWGILKNKDIWKSTQPKVLETVNHYYYVVTKVIDPSFGTVNIIDSYKRVPEPLKGKYEIFDADKNAILLHVAINQLLMDKRL